MLGLYFLHYIVVCNIQLFKELEFDMQICVCVFEEALDKMLALVDIWKVKSCTGCSSIVFQLATRLMVMRFIMEMVAMKSKSMQSILIGRLFVSKYSYGSTDVDT